MILLIAILVGMIAGLLRASLMGRQLQAFTLKHEWLVLVGVLSQLIAFQIPWTSAGIPSSFVPFVLIPSYILLLVFAWLNRNQAGFWLLGAGLLLNLAVILANGGYMPISPSAIQRLHPGSALAAQIGQRFGTTKGIILLPTQTTLYWLSNCFIFPAWTGLRVVFSLGDIVLSTGTFFLFWSLGGPITENKEYRNDLYEQPQPDHVRTGHSPS